MDRVIDFNELKNKVNDKDIDKFESYIYELYYKMAEGKLNMAEFNQEIAACISPFHLQLDVWGTVNAQNMLIPRPGLLACSQSAPV